MRSQPSTARPAAPYSVARLRELHAAPKNNVTVNYRFATPAQMDEFFAMHEAFPALAEAVEAMHEYWRSGDDEASDRVSAALAKFDFAPSDHEAAGDGNDAEASAQRRESRPANDSGRGQDRRSGRGEATIRKAIAAEYALSKELAGYEDKWVAIRNHHVVASADTLNELLRMVGPENDIESCFKVLPAGTVLL